MEKNGASKAQPLVGIILTALAIVLLAGLLTFAGPCAVQAGEETRSCLWASRALIGVDAVLLADFAAKEVHAGDKIIDLGTGTGIIPLLMEGRSRSAEARWLSTCEAGVSKPPAVLQVNLPAHPGMPSE